MNTNERIARQLGWTSREFLVAGTVCTGWARPDGLGESVPDYEHSLDALLEPLGVLRERGLIVRITFESDGTMTTHIYRSEVVMAAGERVSFKQTNVALTNGNITTAALAVAEALEANDEHGSV